MKIRELKREFREKEAKKALDLYRKYGSLRKVAAVTGNSHMWVKRAIERLGDK